MNPRLVCRERSYQKALLLTFSFDPIFFEQVVLPDLWAGRSSDILVLGDRGQVEAGTLAAAGQLWHLGRHYLLAGANHTGFFHPKVVLRLGAKDGVVSVGSSNVTSSGWGGNQELGTAWMVGPEHADKGAWLHAFLDDVMSWCSGELEMDTVRRMKDVPWLAMTPADSGAISQVLYSRKSRALGPALAHRWVGRQFEEARILTGSTDETGAFLRWAHSTFGITRATVALTPGMASWDPEKLADLPVDLRLIRAPAVSPLHAKLYWFDGPDGAAAVMGSANCSAAAWLLSPDQHGNVESIVVYDGPDAEEFSNALALFKLPSLVPAEVLAPTPNCTAELHVVRPEYELLSLSWDNVSRLLRAKISPAPLSDMTVELSFMGQHLPMVRVLDVGELWECSMTEGFGYQTALASIRLRRGDTEWRTQARWIDDIAALHEASHAARLLEPFNDLERNTSSPEQRRMLDELQEVAQTLFNDAAYARDPGFGSERKTKTATDQSAQPVNPNDLVFRLEELSESLPNLSSTGPGTLSLTGIVRLLFDAEGEAGGRLVANEDENIDEGQLPNVNPRADANGKDQVASVPQQSKPIEERFRERLAAQIRVFLEEMSSPTFAGRCSATQLVQAVAFPLAVGLRGQLRGWVPEELAESWALEVFSILFRRDGAGATGLIAAVEQRYKQNDRETTFREVVGDGTLWVVLVATLGNSRWKGIGTEIDKAVALREVFTAPQLLALANPTRIAGLLGKIRIEDARAYVAQVAPKATHLLDQIEITLRPIWEREMRAQSEQALLHKVGDLLWRDKVGWAVCLGEEAANSARPIRVRLRGVDRKVLAGYYVNVTHIASRDSDLQALVDNLRSIVSTIPRQTSTVSDLPKFVAVSKG